MAEPLNNSNGLGIILHTGMYIMNNIMSRRTVIE